MRKLSPYLAMAALAGSTLLSANAFADGEQYQVTITNLTRAQAFTPILVSSHRKGVSLFEPGAAASSELATLAEGGDVAPLTAVLEANDRVRDIANSGGLLMPGQSVSVTVAAGHGARFISLASMLIPTNDSFIALNSVKAPKRHGRTRVYYSPGYDAGTEPNDELCMNIPGPVCGGEGGSPGAGGEGFVHISRGIAGIGDLDSATYDWKNPVARIVIERIDGDDED